MGLFKIHGRRKAIELIVRRSSWNGSIAGKSVCIQYVLSPVLRFNDRQIGTRAGDLCFIRLNAPKRDWHLAQSSLSRDIIRNWKSARLSWNLEKCPLSFYSKMRDFHGHNKLLTWFHSWGIVRSFQYFRLTFHFAHLLRHISDGYLFRLNFLNGCD